MMAPAAKRLPSVREEGFRVTRKVPAAGGTARRVKWMKFHPLLPSESPFPIRIARHCLVLLQTFNENKHFACFVASYRIESPISGLRRPLSHLREPMQDLAGTIQGQRGALNT